MNNLEVRVGFGVENNNYTRLLTIKNCKEYLWNIIID